VNHADGHELSIMYSFYALCKQYIIK